MTIQSDLNTLHQPHALIDLLTLDCTALGGSVYRFTPMFAEAPAYLSFAGEQYLSIPIAMEGWDYSISGTQPRPSLQISNINQPLLAAVIGLGDLVGATVTRIRTYAKNLDGEPGADSSEYLGPDIFQIEQKLSHSATLITWQLSSFLERFGSKLPARQILKDGSEDPTVAALNRDGSFRSVYAPGIRRAY